MAIVATVIMDMAIAVMAIAIMAVIVGITAVTAMTIITHTTATIGTTTTITIHTTMDTRMAGSVLACRFLVLGSDTGTMATTIAAVIISNSGAAPPVQVPQC